MLLPSAFFAALFRQSVLRDILILIGLLLMIVGLLYYWYRNTKGSKLFNQWLLPIMAILSPLPIYIRDRSFAGECNAFLGTAVYTVLFAVPFLIVSIILAINITKKTTQ